MRGPTTAQGSFNLLWTEIKGHRGLINLLPLYKYCIIFPDDYLLLFFGSISQSLQYLLYPSLNLL